MATASVTHTTALSGQASHMLLPAIQIIGTASPAPQQQQPTVAQQSQTNAAVTTVVARRTHRKRLTSYLSKTWLSNLMTLLGIAAAVVGLAWVLYSGLISLSLQRWSAKNDMLQSCLAFAEVDQFSTYCNETLAAGVLPPPIIKRAFSEPISLAYDFATEKAVLEVLISLLKAAVAGYCIKSLSSAAGLVAILYMASRTLVAPPNAEDPILEKTDIWMSFRRLDSSLIPRWT